jgi:hypothetical protein
VETDCEDADDSLRLYSVLSCISFGDEVKFVAAIVDAREREGVRISVVANAGDTVGLAVLEDGNPASSFLGSRMLERCAERERGVPVFMEGAVKVEVDAVLAPLELGLRSKVGEGCRSSALSSIERSVGRLDVGLGLATALLLAACAGTEVKYEGDCGNGTFGGGKGRD